MKQKSINLCLSANQEHLAYAATVVASVCRRTRWPVHARVYVRNGDSPEAFQAGNLIVEFVRPLAPLNESLPWQVRSCVCDRMEIVEDATDWDRCWVLDIDQIALVDLGELDGEDFAGGWMIAHRTCTAGEGGFTAACRCQAFPSRSPPPAASSAADSGNQKPELSVSNKPWRPVGNSGCS